MPDVAFRSLAISIQTFDGRKFDYHRPAEVVHYQHKSGVEQLNLLVKVNLDLRLPEHRGQNLVRDVRFKGPHLSLIHI